LLEDTDKQIGDLNEKLSDKDTLDGLSPEAIDEMQNKLAMLREEMGRYQQQYYQFMQQGQNKIMQSVFGGITQASEKIAAAKGYTMILNKQACFYNAPTLDVTADMIKEMDKNFEDEAKKQAAATPPVSAVAPVAAAPELTRAEAKKEETKQTAVAPEVKPEVKKEEAKPATAKAEEKKSAATDVKKSK